MYQQLLRGLKNIEKFVSRPWYVPLVAVLAAIDMFIFIVPTDALLISATIVRPKKWLLVAVSVALGSVTGAMIMALLIRYMGQSEIGAFFMSQIGEDAWKTTESFFINYGGWTFFGVALGPFPLMPATIVGAATQGVSLKTLFWGALAGRVLKFGLFSWAATHSPKLLSRIQPKDSRAKDA